MDGYIGMIIPWAGTWAPMFWHFCDGELLQITQNTALYAIIGTQYGGDGRTTFALPDLRYRTIMGMGINPRTNEGETEVKMFDRPRQTTLPGNSLPVHVHNFEQTCTGTISNLTLSQPVNTGNATQTSPAGAYPAVARTSTSPVMSYAATATTGVSLAAANGSGTFSVPVSGTTTVAGAGYAFDTWPSYITMRYIICVQGIFPSQG